MSNIKLTQKKSNGSLNSPNYVLSYKNSASENTISTRYSIILKLIDTNDVIVEINSTLINLPKSEIETYLMNFTKSLKELGLDYRYRKNNAMSNSLFSIFSLKGNKTSQTHEILTYIPNDILKSDAFMNIYPQFGARYFIFDKPVENSTILDDFSNMFDSEKFEIFKLIVFDSNLVENMGIISATMTKDDLQRLLK